MAQRPRPNDNRRWWAALTDRLPRWLGGRRRTEQPAVRQESMERGHEPEDGTTSTGGILAAGVLLVVGTGVVILLSNVFLNFLEGRGTTPASETRIAAPDASVSDVPPRPRLQVDPAVDLQEMHQREDERLHEYGRLDSARLHIPIERAMQLIAERGLPADTTAGSDSMRVPTESGFRTVYRGFSSEPQPYLGSSPEPYTPAPEFRRFLTEEGYLPRTDSAR